MINTLLINLTCNDKLLEARDSIQELSFGGTSLYEFGKRRTIEAGTGKNGKVSFFRTLSWASSN